METSFQLNPNITFQNTKSEDDFWQSLFDTPYTKHLIFDCSVLTIALLFPMFILIFMHIQDKGYRTVLTYGEVMCYFYAFVYLYISFPLDVIRIISGPLPQSICWFTIYAKNFAVFGGQFGFIVCIIIRYLFTVVYKSVAICHDDIFGFFLYCQSLLFCLLVTYLKMSVPGKYGLNYYICTGEDPEPYMNLGGKFPISAIISLGTLVTYTGVSFRLALEKRQMETLEALGRATLLGPSASTIQTRQPGFWDKYFPHVSKYAWSTIDLKNLYSCMFVIVGDSMLWNKYTKELTAMELQTSGMGQFCFLLHQYLLGMVAVWTLVINTFLRKEELRKFSSETLRDLIRDLFPRPPGHIFPH